MWFKLESEFVAPRVELTEVSVGGQVEIHHLRLSAHQAQQQLLHIHHSSIPIFISDHMLSILHACLSLSVYLAGYPTVCLPPGCMSSLSVCNQSICLSVNVFACVS
jgi:hypothetical protein